MSQWVTLFEGEVQGRPVKLEFHVYESGERFARVTTVTAEDEEGAAPREGEYAEDSVISQPTRRPVMVEPDELSDLVEELLELGFSDEAAIEIVRNIPDQNVS